MAFPPELADYKNEDDFIQRFVIPLLKRRGFSVVNYHGVREHGRDLIFAEIDRFGHVRYHGLQAKYVESLGLEAMGEVTDDCKQAFTITFDHPQTGIKEYISTFYAVNGGSISDTARERYFAYLKPRHGDNAKLIDGKGLVVLDRWATITRQQLIEETLAGLLLEIGANTQKVTELLPMLKQIVTDPTAAVSYNQLRNAAVSGYLASPVAMDSIPYDVVGAYCDQTQVINHLLDSLLGFQLPERKLEVAQGIITVLPAYSHWAGQLNQAIGTVLNDLGPLTKL